MISKIYNSKMCKTHMMVFVLFCIAVFFRSFVSDYLKVYDFFPDSLRFYDIARNMIDNKWYVVRNIKIDYQKILYSICIIPFFYIKNAVLRIRMIDIFNSIVACSSIFPFYILTDNILKDEKYKKISLLLYAFSPIFLYTDTLLSENLYITLWMWSSVVMFYAMKNDRTYMYVVSAILYFVSYMCREIMFIYYIATIVTLICIRLCMIHKCEEKDILNIVAFSLTFLILHIISNITIFKGIGYTYGINGSDQISIKALLSLENIMNFIYSNIYMLCGMMLVFFIVPIIILIDNIAKMEKLEKAIFLMNVLNVLGLIVVTVYTITIREDTYLDFPRLHFRYMIGSVPLLSALVFNHIDDESIKNVFSKKRNIFIIVVILAVVFIFFTGLKTSTLDQPFIYWYILVSRLMKDIVKCVNVNIDEVILVDILIFGIFICLYVMYKKNRVCIIKYAIIVFFVASCIVNNIYGMVHIRNVQEINDTYINDMAKLYAVIGDDEKVLMIATNDTRSIASKVVDIYSDKYVIFQPYESLINKHIESASINNMKFYDKVLHKNYSISNVNYVLVEKNEMQNMLDIDESIEFMMDLYNYVLYKIDG